MSEESLAQNEGTETSGNETNTQEQSATKTYTQEEFDNHMAGLKNSLTKKFEKKLEGLGDLEELKQLKEQSEKRKMDEATKRGEFEKVLSELAEKKDAEIQKRDAIIKDYKVNTPILEAAAKLNAVNAEQVRTLLSPQVRLNSDGEVEVVDAEGNVRYNDSGKALKVNDLVDEFLTTNPHFRAANPATTATKSNISAKEQKELDVTKLDMSKAEDRARYKEYKKAKGLV